MPARLEVGMCLLVLACGTPAPAAAPSVGPPDPPAPAPVVPVAPAAIVERVSLVLHAPVQDGLRLAGLGLGDATHAGRADVQVGDEALWIPIPGCAQGAGSGWSVEHADPGPAPWARFVRTPSMPAIDGEDRAPHDIAITGSITASRYLVTLRRIEPRADGTCSLALETSHPDISEGGPQPLDVLLRAGEVAERAIGDQVLRLALGDAQLLGCPTVRVAILDPSSEIVDVADGETGAVPRLARLRLGDVTIRWDGWAEARRMPPRPSVVLLSFRGQVGDGEETSFGCHLDDPCAFDDVTIEVVELQVGRVSRSTFRLHRAPTAAPAP